MDCEFHEMHPMSSAAHQLFAQLECVSEVVAFAVPDPSRVWDALAVTTVCICGDDCECEAMQFCISFNEILTSLMCVAFYNCLLLFLTQLPSLRKINRTFHTAARRAMECAPILLSDFRAERRLFGVIVPRSYLQLTSARMWSINASRVSFDEHEILKDMFRRACNLRVFHFRATMVFGAEAFSEVFSALSNSCGNQWEEVLWEQSQTDIFNEVREKPFLRRLSIDTYGYLYEPDLPRMSTADSVVWARLVSLCITCFSWHSITNILEVLADDRLPCLRSVCLSGNAVFRNALRFFERHQLLTTVSFRDTGSRLPSLPSMAALSNLTLCTNSVRILAEKLQPMLSTVCLVVDPNSDLRVTLKRYEMALQGVLRAKPTLPLLQRIQFDYLNKRTFHRGPWSPSCREILHDILDLAKENGYEVLDGDGLCIADQYVSRTLLPS